MGRKRSRQKKLFQVCASSENEEIKGDKYSCNLLNFYLTFQSIEKLACANNYPYRITIIKQILDRR